MIVGFDHVVIAVADLAAETELFTGAGFHVVPGGSHRGRGTHNAVIALDNGYLELISVADRYLALRFGGNPARAVRFLETSPRGVMGYAVTAAGIEDDVRRLEQGGYAPSGPTSVSRERTDGSVIGWRLAVPRGESWGRSWPFLIEWDRPEFSPASDATEHSNGITRVTGLSITTTDVNDAVQLYRDGLGLPVTHETPTGFRAALGGDVTVDLEAGASTTMDSVVLSGPGVGRSAALDELALLYGSVLRLQPDPAAGNA